MASSMMAQGAVGQHDKQPSRIINVLIDSKKKTKTKGIMVNGNTASSSSINLNNSSNTYENFLPEAANIITVPNEAKFDRVMEQHFRYD